MHLASGIKESYKQIQKGKSNVLVFEKKDVEFIKANFENYKELLNSEDVNFVLRAIDYLILKKGFYDYDYNDFGREAQKIYDSIYLNN